MRLCLFFYPSIAWIIFGRTNTSEAIKNIAVASIIRIPLYQSKEPKAVYLKQYQAGIAAVVGLGAESHSKR